MDIQDQVFAQHRAKYAHLSDIDYVMMIMQERYRIVGHEKFVAECKAVGFNFPDGWEDWVRRNW